jgi:hypothetical protein
VDPGISLEKQGHAVSEARTVPETTAFFSTCPRCKQTRLQNGYRRTELVESLGAAHEIDAYCLQCDVVWPITAQERFLIARGITPLHEPPLSVRKRLL